MFLLENLRDCREQKFSLVSKRSIEKLRVQNLLLHTSSIRDRNAPLHHHDTDSVPSYTFFPEGLNLL